MPRRHIRGLARFISLWWLLCVPAFSAGATDLRAMSAPHLFVGLEYFAWEEFNDADQSLLEEIGSRVVFGALKGNVLHPGATALYEVQLRNYFGDVLYDGQTQSGQPLETDVEYRGNQLRIALGARRHIEVLGLIDAVDVVGALGVEHWSRDIEDGVTSTGVRAVGIKEDYYVRYQEFGIGVAQFRGARAAHLLAGARKPLETREGVAIFDGPVTLSPGREWSMFARLRSTVPSPFKGAKTAISAYYEGYRFSKSPAVATSIGGQAVQVLQPKSNMDMLGVQYEVQF